MTGYPTLLDQVKATDPEGRVADVVEALQQKNPILMDAPAFEGNLSTGHRFTVRTALPTVYARAFNEGYASGKSQRKQVDEAACEIKGRSTLDVSLAKLNGNGAEFRASEDRAFVQSFNQEVARQLFYGDRGADAKEMDGFRVRYDGLSTNVVDPQDANCLASGITTGAADQRSMWFITWGEDTAHLITPKGYPAGLQMEDVGKIYVADSGGTNEYLAYATDWQWNLGLVVKDWRYHVRICNIDEGNFSASGGKLLDAMVKAYNHIHDFSSGKTVIYTTREVRSFIDLEIMAKSNIWFSPVEWHGHAVAGFRGIPILTVDALNTDEAIVT